MASGAGKVIITRMMGKEGGREEGRERRGEERRVNSNLLMSNFYDKPRRIRNCLK